MVAGASSGAASTFGNAAAAVRFLRVQERHGTSRQSAIADGRSSGADGKANPYGM